MRLSIGGFGYNSKLISRDLTATELAALLDTLEGAFLLKSDQYGDDAEYFLDTRKVSDVWNIIDGNDDSIPRDLRLFAKEAENKAVREQKTDSTLPIAKS